MISCFSWPRCPSRCRPRSGRCSPAEVLEVVMDLGRPPEARLIGRVMRLSEAPVTAGDLEHVLAQVGPRARTIAPASSARSTASPPSATARASVVGLTLRVGRAIFGTIDMLKDLIASGLNMLLLGPARRGQDDEAARGGARARG